MKLNLKPSTIINALAIALVFFMVGSYVGYAYLRPYVEKKAQTTATTTASKFVNHLVSNQSAEAYTMTSKALQKNQSKDEFSKTAGSVKTDSPVYGVPQTLRDGSSVVYIQKVDNLSKSASGSTSANFYITMDKEKNDWKISSVTVQ